jgi:hypothetical protein
MARKKLRVGILFGGKSGEHEISLRSARSILKAIDRKRYDVVELAAGCRVVRRRACWVVRRRLLMRLVTAGCRS